LPLVLLFGLGTALEEMYTGDEDFGGVMGGLAPRGLGNRPTSSLLLPTRVLSKGIVLLVGPLPPSRVFIVDWLEVRLRPTALSEKS
jgi:hypothetical protein